MTERPSAKLPWVVNDWVCPRCDQPFLVVQWQADQHLRLCENESLAAAVSELSTATNDQQASSNCRSASADSSVTRSEVSTNLSTNDPSRAGGAS